MNSKHPNHFIHGLIIHTYYFILITYIIIPYDFCYFLISGAHAAPIQNSITFHINIVIPMLKNTSCVQSILWFLQYKNSFILSGYYPISICIQFLIMFFIKIWVPHFFTKIGMFFSFINKLF